MKYLKTFEKYSEKYFDDSIDFNYVKNLTDKDILEIYNEYESEYPEEEKKESIINSLINLRDSMSNVSNGLIILYRILSLKNIDKIDKNNLGEHYVISTNDIDSIFLYDIGYKDDTNRDIYIVKIEVDVKYINFNRTINMRIDYPHEREISLLSDENIEIIWIKEFEM